MGKDRQRDKRAERFLQGTEQGCKTGPWRGRDKLDGGKNLYFVFLNNVLNVPKKDDITGKWRRLHNEELHDLHSTPNIIRVIKARRLRDAEHLARADTAEMHTGIWWWDLRKINHLEDMGLDRRIILKCIFEGGFGAWTRFICLRIGMGGGGSLWMR